MSKSPLYQNASRGNSNELMEFLSSKDVWDSPELDCAVTVKFNISGEYIEFPLYRNLPQSTISEILGKFGFSYSDFEEFAKGVL